MVRACALTLIAVVLLSCKTTVIERTVTLRDTVIVVPPQTVERMLPETVNNDSVAIGANGRDTVVYHKRQRLFRARVVGDTAHVVVRNVESTQSVTTEKSRWQWSLDTLLLALAVVVLVLLLVTRRYDRS